MMDKTSRYPQRVRNELRFRELTVLRVERIGTGFQRIVLGGDALEGFNSRGFDDHSKVFFPQPGGRFVPPTVTEKGLSGARACVRLLAITHRCTMKPVMSWRWISLFTTAVWRAVGL